MCIILCRVFLSFQWHWTRDEEKKRLETVVDNVVVAAAAVSAAAASASAVAGLLLLLLLLTPPASGHLTTLRCRCPHRRPAVGKGKKRQQVIQMFDKAKFSQVTFARYRR